MRALLVVALAVFAVAAQAQVPADTLRAPADTLESSPIDDQLEVLVEEDLLGDPTELLELIESLRENPLDVNSATAEELAQVPAFSPLVAAAIVRYRLANGTFASLPELQRVDGITPEIYLAARPFIFNGPRIETAAVRAPRFPSAPSLSTVLDGLRYTATQRVQRRLDLGEGFEGPDSTRRFLGSPERIYTRVQARYRRQLSVNVTLEKDPGERFRFDGATNTYGYDYLSGHAAILDMGRIDALVVGDFSAEFGQGVALWRASGFGKGPEAVQGPIRSGRGIRPYGSVDENNFFRGAALTLAVTPGVFVSAFASRRALDASVFTPDSSDLATPDLPDIIDGTIVTGLGADGLHRTDRELARKDALGETLVGGGAEYRVSNGDVEGRAGVVATRSTFSVPLAAGDRPDERFEFSGDEATVVSAYADAKTRAGQVFGEAVRGAGGGFGGVAGAVADLGGNADLLIVGRHYGRDFTALHGYAFGERNGVGSNETGLYVGARVRPSRTWTVNAYFDRYRFPYLRFNIPRPSQGYETLLKVEHRPRRYLRGYLQARSETRERGIDVANTVPGSVVGGLALETRQTLRLHGEWEADRTLRFRARIEGSRYVDPEADAPTQYGSLVYQDVRWQATRRVRADLRLTLFDTDGYDSRLYAFENDLTGVFSIPALAGEGVRAYVLLSTEPLDGLRVQAKLAATWIRNARRVGSGANQVEGNRISDLGVQVRYQF